MGEGLQILLLGRELLGLGHLRLVSDAQLGKKHLAQLARRVDVKVGLASKLTHLIFKALQHLAKLHSIAVEGSGVDMHTLQLHRRKHINHRLFDAVVEVGHRELLDFAIEHLFKA